MREQGLPNELGTRIHYVPQQSEEKNDDSPEEATEHFRVNTDSEESQEGSMEPNENETWAPSKQIKMVLAGQAFCVFIVSLDMTILTATLPTVAKALEANATKTFWIAAAYLLANAVCQPTMAALADIFGRRAIFFGAVVFFTVGSIICATAPNVSAMLAGRTIQGIGGGGVVSVNLIILSDLVPLRQRSKYQGMMQLVFALGTNIAPILGGALVKTSWRWLFWINLPFCGIGLAIIPFLLRYERPESSIYTKLSSVDWIGSALIIISSTVFLTGISWGGNEFSWRSAAVIVPLTAGVIGMMLTVVYERKYARVPFLRLALFQHWSAIAAYVCTVLQGFILFASLYYCVMYLLACKLYKPTVAGSAILPLGLAVVPVSGFTGVLIARMGHYKWSIWTGWTLSTIGCGLLVVLDVATSPAAWVFIFICAGAGQGLLLIGHSVAVQASCKPQDAAHASGMYSFSRSFGLCMGVVVGGTIFQNFLRMRSEQVNLPVSMAENAEAFVPVLQGLSGVTGEKLEYQQAYAWALRMLFSTLTGVSAVGLLISLAIGSYTLDKALDSKHVLRSRNSNNPGRSISER